MTPEELARLFHETYERLAPSFGYDTRPESAVPWESVPAKNRSLMIAVAAEVQEAVCGDLRTLIRDVVTDLDKGPDAPLSIDVELRLRAALAARLRS